MQCNTMGTPYANARACWSWMAGVLRADGMPRAVVLTRQDSLTRPTLTVQTIGTGERWQADRIELGDRVISAMLADDFNGCDPEFCPECGGIMKISRAYGMLGEICMGCRFFRAF